MDLAFNAAAPFTRWIVASGALRSPFVVVDVGVQGGENPRWHLLGDHLVVHGLDPIIEVVETLRRQTASQSNRFYHWVAAGNEDGEREFYFNAADPCSSSLYPQGADRFQAPGKRVEQPRKVPMRRLDTFLADGTIAPADFLKVDVEGFEQDVFAGAKQLLAETSGVETETNFGISPTYPKSHFVTLHEMLLEHRLLVFDLNYNRVPRASFQAALQKKGIAPINDQESVGKPATVVALFCRDHIAEVAEPQNYVMPPRGAPTLDRLLKTMVVCELHGLSDIALDTAVHFRDQLGERIDVDKAAMLLADPHCRRPSYSAIAARLAAAEAAVATLRAERPAYRRRLEQIERHASSRATAALRSIRRFVPF